MDLCRGAYDGRGNAVVKDAADIEAAVASLGGVEHGLYAEQWAPFVKVTNPILLLSGVCSGSFQVCGGAECLVTVQSLA